MKSLLVFVVSVACLVMSVCVQKVDIEAEKAKVKSVVDQFAQATDTENMELFSKIMARDADMVNFGTDAAERYVGWEPLKTAVEKQFASFDNAKITSRDQVIKVLYSGKVAWFSEILDFDVVAQGQSVRLEGIRLTGVLEKRNGNWIFMQVHNSVPVSGQAVEY